MRFDFADLAQKIDIAKRAGDVAADACPDDGGSANLDHVVLYDLKGIRTLSMKKAGIACYRGRAGQFHLSRYGWGQGNRNYAGVQAMCKSLQNQGVKCWVHYQLD